MTRSTDMQEPRLLPPCPRGSAPRRSLVVVMLLPASAPKIVGVVVVAAVLALAASLLATRPAAASAPRAGTQAGSGSLALDAQAESDRLVTQARRLIVDALPEDRSSANELLIEAIRLSPHHTEAFAELSRFILWQVSMRFMQPHALAQAAALARHVRELDPSRPLGTYLVCEMMLALGQAKAAEDLFRVTRKEFPNHTDTAVFEARYLSESNPTVALSSATKALAAGVGMDSLSPAITAAIEQLAGGNAARLAEDLKAFVTVYPDRWLWHRMAMTYRDLNKFTEAARAFERAIALGNTIESRLHLGVMLYSDMNQPAQATALFHSLLAALQSRAAPRPSALALVESHLALAELKAGRTAEAAQHAENSLLRSPSDEALVAQLVDVFDTAGALPTLEAPLAKLVAANPEAAVGHIVLSQIASRRKAHSAAAKHMSNAIAMSPERDDLYAARALFRYEMLDFALALSDFERAIELRPDAGVHYYNRACMLALLGRQREAMNSLREAVLLDGQFAKHARSDKDLVGLLERKEFAGELADIGVIESEKNGTEAARTVATGQDPRLDAGARSGGFTADTQATTSRAGPKPVTGNERARSAAP